MNPPGEPMRIPVVFKDAGADVTASIAEGITAARAAQPRWSRTPVDCRLRLIRKLRQLIAEHAAPLAEASAAGRCRPAAESLTAEVLPLAEACRFLESAAVRALRPRRLGRRGLPLWLAGVRAEIHREPLGIVLIIGPGNYPLFLPGAQLLQALAAGNAVLLKPGAGGTPAARALLDLLARAGFDPQLVALLPESAETARAAILARPNKVLFTGSAATGERILTQLAPHLIPATMELSGCDAAIIRGDADLDLVAKALAFAVRLNGGATCMAPKRIFVHRSVATELEGRLARAFHPCGCRHEDLPAKREQQGHAAPVTTPGLRPFIEDALARGAHFIAGEELAGDAVILGGVDPSSRLLHEDLFARCLPLYP